MKVFCILSDERAFHSRSPVMFSTVLRRQGINAVYVPFMVQPASLGRAMEGLRVLNIAGANVTAPFKETIIPHLDGLSEGARFIGAINTIVRDGDKLKGYNTNAIGIMDAMRAAGFNVEDKSALVFGTGGAARTVAFILTWLRAREVWVVGRNAERARAIVTAFSGRGMDPAVLAGLPLPAQIVINATSVSSPEEAADLAGLVETLDLRGCELMLDLNYGRRRNFWQDKARALGVHFMDGLSPLAFQARRTLQLWTGIQVPPEEFIRALQNGDGQAM
ncbi:MAG: shikimate dehydrogenase [Desulfobacterales bacterium]|jgi:shikimate dehydrogenase|nr:shikimate dehydrogenase [Desulfobacterales bacterium]